MCYTLTVHAVIPVEPAGQPSAPPAEPTVDLFGIPVTDCSLDDAVARLESIIRSGDRRARSVYFVNAHTLNVACDDPSYADVVRRAALVFGDGTGVRWAARYLHGLRLRDNVNGTDLVPHLLRTTAGRGYRFYMVASTPEAIERAAAHVKTTFPGWELVGHHHGYVPMDCPSKLLERINASGADVLLVGMGNPKQEQWIEHNRGVLRVPVCMAIGGLIDYWAGNVRAPLFMRRLGMEWVWIVLRQPHKLRRYALGNPTFLVRMVRRGGLARLVGRR